MAPPSDRRRRLERALAALGEVLLEDAPEHVSRWVRVSSLAEPKLARRWVREGKLPSARPSKHLLVDVTVFDELVAQHARNTAPANDTDGDLDPRILRRAAP